MHQPDAAFAFETLVSLLLNQIVVAHAAKLQRPNQGRPAYFGKFHLKNVERFIDNSIEGPIRIADLAAISGATTTKANGGHAYAHAGRA